MNIEYYSHKLKTTKTKKSEPLMQGFYPALYRQGAAGVVAQGNCQFIDIDFIFDVNLYSIVFNPDDPGWQALCPPMRFCPLRSTIRRKGRWLIQSHYQVKNVAFTVKQIMDLPRIYDAGAGVDSRSKSERNEETYEECDR